jgi:hypothetical protein
MVTGYTNYFRDKWKQQFQEEPSVEKLNKQMDLSIRIQPYLIFWDSKAAKLVKILASYWIPDSNIVVKVDFESKSFVTYYSPQDITSEVEKVVGT